MTTALPSRSRRRWTGAAALSLLAVSTLPAGTADAYEPYMRGTGARVAGLGDVGSGPDPEFATVLRGSTHDVAVVSASSGIELWHCEGEDAVAIPDQDGDGRPDVVIALRSSYRGEWAAICNGKTGERLAVLTAKKSDGTPYEGKPGKVSDSVALIDDATGDGCPKLLIVRTTRGEDISTWCSDARAFVVSLDGTVVAEFDTTVDPRNRSPVAAVAGDVDGDGRGDVFVCVESKRGWLPLELRSIAGDTLLAFKGASLGPPPTAFARCADLDGDGIREILIGMAHAARGKFDSAGELRVISGKDGHQIRAVKGTVAGELLGRSIVVLPDIDGDGVADYAVGAPGAPTKSKTYSGGRVTAYSGKKGKVIWTAEGEDGLVDFGESVDVLADVDDDGVLDVVVGAPGGGGPREAGFVRVLSGKTGATLRTYAGDPDRMVGR